MSEPVTVVCTEGEWDEGMILLAGLVTVFGIGMEIGIVAVLIALCQATHWARAIMWALLFAVVIGTLRYSVTALRTIADPEPDRA